MGKSVCSPHAHCEQWPGNTKQPAKRGPPRQNGGCFVTRGVSEGKLRLLGGFLGIIVKPRHGGRALARSQVNSPINLPETQLYHRQRHHRNLRRATQTATPIPGHEPHKYAAKLLARHQTQAVRGQLQTYSQSSPPCAFPNAPQCTARVGSLPWRLSLNYSS